MYHASRQGLSPKESKTKPAYIEYLNKHVYPWLETKIGFQRKTPFRPVDFNKHWITIYRSVWPFIVFDSATYAVYSLMYTYWPLVIFYGAAHDPRLILWYAVVHASTILLSIISGFFYTTAMVNMVANFDVSVTQFFLVSDPINHATKSSGQITAKVSRAKGSLEPLSSSLSFNIIPAFIELGSISLGFFSIGAGFGWYTTGFFVFATLFLVASRRYIFSPILKWSFKYSDAVSSVALEILQQQNFIRTTMASDLMMNKYSSMSKKLISVMNTRRNTNTIYSNMIRGIWFVSLVGLLAQFYYNGLFSATNTIALGLLIAYIQNAGTINRLGSILSSTYELSTDIDDLYDYIQEFGSNSYPVISTPESNQKK